MKKLFYLLLAGTLFLANSCKDDDDSANAISTSEAAEVTAAAIASNSGGASGYIESSANSSATDNNNFLKLATVEYVLCDSTYSDNGSIVSASAGVIGTWSYSWTYRNALLLADPTNLSTITSVFNYSGDVDLPKFSSSHSGNGSFVYSGLITLAYALDSIWTLNGTFSRTATHTSKTTSKQINSTTDIRFQDCEVYSNGSRKIVSGMAYITIKGSVPDKGEFEYTGSFTYLGNGTGTLNIDGNTYTINITTGEVK